MRMAKFAIVFAGMFAAAAYADDGALPIQIKGILKGGFRSVSGLDAAGTQVAGSAGGSLRSNKISDFGSELDFAGSEVVGPNLVAIWQINTNLTIDEGSKGGTVGSGDTFVGLKSPWGTIKLGHGVNAYGDGYFKGNFNSPEEIGPANAGIDAGGNKGAIKYESPTIAGFSAALSWAAGENKTGATPASDAWALGATYEQNMWGIRAGYAAQKYNLVSGFATKKDWLLAAVFMPVAGMKLGAEYDSANDGVDGTPGQKSLGVFGEYKPGVFGVRGGYVRTNNLAYSADVKESKFNLGVDYDLSKRTRALIEISASKKTDFNRVTGVSIGMRHAF